MELLIKNLYKRYGDVVALNNFGFSFKKGIYGILGANGAGKSTMMNLIADNIKRQSGEILFNGTDILRLGKSFRKVLGYMPQEQGMYDELSAQTFLYYMSSLKGVPKRQAKKQIDNLLEVVALTKDAHKKLGGYSGGMRQRVLLAQALLGEPKIIILDEPTAGLDPKERIRMRNYISNLGKNKIVLITTHIVSDIETIASEILLINQGELVISGSPLELKDKVNGDNLEDVYMSYLGE